MCIHKGKSEGQGKGMSNAAMTTDLIRKQPLTVLIASLALLMAAAVLTGCASPTALPEDARPHDQRVYVPPEATTFAALAEAPGQAPVPSTHRFAGVLNGAAYLIEVPQQGWNGQLLMWAHGYAGTGPKLIVNPPLMRRHLLARGYAWAASSYTKNHYDVRAGVEDTNALALAFNKLTGAQGVPLPVPSKYFIAGVSMGGHIAAAAVERETLASARHVVRYAAAMPLCGVLGDTELFSFFGAYQFAAMQLAGLPARSFPFSGWPDVAPAVKDAIFSTYPQVRTAQGERLKRLVTNLSGGARPFFTEGFDDKGMQDNVWNGFGSDGSLNGVLTLSIVDTRHITYSFAETPGTPSAVEAFFNQHIHRAVPVAEANRQRRDGLRWVPVLHGEFDVPVMSLHTLGDLFVPFRMQQIYHQRAAAKGREKLLVQRAIRDVAHCSFTAAEASAAFDDLVRWQANGHKPAGDDVHTPAVLASADYGCRFTDNRSSPQDFSKADRRAAAQAKYPACPINRTETQTP
jgi:hypothetical protein